MAFNPAKIQTTEIDNYRRLLKLGPEVSDDQIRNAIAKVEPWLFDRDDESQQDMMDCLMEEIN